MDQRRFLMRASYLVGETSFFPCEDNSCSEAGNVGLGRFFQVPTSDGAPQDCLRQVVGHPSCGKASRLDAMCHLRQAQRARGKSRACDPVHFGRPPADVASWQKQAPEQAFQARKQPFFSGVPLHVGSQLLHQPPPTWTSPTSRMRESFWCWE